MSRPTPSSRHIVIQDVTLPALRSRFGHEALSLLARALDGVGVDGIVLPAGDWALAGLLADDGLRAVLSMPVEDVMAVERARTLGIRAIRVLVGNLELAAPIIAAGHEAGLHVTALPIDGHLHCPGDLARQAQSLEGFGANCIHVVDAVGVLDMDGVAARLRAFDRLLSPATERGISASHDVSLAVANALVAVQNGAVRVDAALAGGTNPLAHFITAATRKGWRHGCDPQALAQVAGMLGCGPINPEFVKERAA